MNKYFNLEIELAKVWKGSVIYIQPQEFSYVFAALGKQISNLSFTSPLDRDFTVTQSNLFSCPVILTDKRFFPDIWTEFFLL